MWREPPPSRLSVPTAVNKEDWTFFLGSFQAWDKWMLRCFSCDSSFQLLWLQKSNFGRTANVINLSAFSKEIHIFIVNMSASILIREFIICTVELHSDDFPQHVMSV